MPPLTRRKRFILSGRVQGVGFRPFVYRLASEFALSGFVRNGPEGVNVEVQGEAERLEAFSEALLTRLPPLARVHACREEELAALPGEKSFRIITSTGGQAHAVLPSPDIATCPDCLAELQNPSDRRHDYPFINCTNCGPRYTITESLPYDRACTTMACFPLCPDCAGEYSDPVNRRFHAQPNACPLCGPQIWFAERGAANRTLETAELKGQAGLLAAVQALASGKIVALKGLGGFHLVCDAHDAVAVQELRRRKNRPHKPLAVMAGSLEEASALAVVGPEEAALLLSSERPIVICPLPEKSGPASWLAPDGGGLGIMLPYTPLHHLLLREFAREKGGAGALVMTSGNRGGEPIALGNREALASLGEIADAFLLHNRDILIRTDDSVVRPLPRAGMGEEEDSGAAPLFLRRSRGFTPAPLPLPSLRRQPVVLALGAELKNSICCSRGENAFVSQHIGDLQNLETAGFQREIAAHLPKMLQVEPELAVCDLHPDFISTALGLEYQAQGLPLLRVQHHLAHAHAVLAENSWAGPALVLALDGSGFSPDGTVWGGEMLLVDGPGKYWKRLGCLQPLDLPGSEAAIREPWRLAHALLYRLGLLDGRPLPWLEEYAAGAALIPQMIDRKLNTPSSSGCGRLFDAASALLGLCSATSYEGQAAIRLEAAQGECPAYVERPPSLWPCPVLEGVDEKSGEPLWLAGTHSLFAALAAEHSSGAATPLLARKFHASLAAGLADLALAGARAGGVKCVGLSGGVMQNLTMLKLLREELGARGLKVLTHKALPPGDACIAYGQTAWALYNAN